MKKYKIYLNNHVAQDGKSQLYLQFFDGKRYRYPLGIYVKPALWDAKKQVIKGKDKVADDTNLLLDNHRAKINEIMVTAKLQGVEIGAEKILHDFEKPELKRDFLTFMQNEIQRRKLIYGRRHSKNHQVTFRKLLLYTGGKIKFSEINFDFVNGFHEYLKEQGYKAGTILTNMKIFRTYLNLAIKKGIRIEPVFKNVKVDKPESNRTFLTTTELRTWIEYYRNENTPKPHKRVLQYYLLACVTNGARHGDIKKINNRSSIVNGNLVYIAEKTKKHNKQVNVPLTQISKLFINSTGDTLFDYVYSEKETNEILKLIAKATDTKKHITFHTARHTFATQFLISGGSIVLLKEILKHSKIETTLIYEHLVQQAGMKEQQLNKFSNFLLKKDVP